MPQQKSNDMQGEGNYTAAKEYDEATQAFIKSGKVNDAAKNAAPKNPTEAREMQEAEEKGRAHAKPGLNEARTPATNPQSENAGVTPTPDKAGKPSA